MFFYIICFILFFWGLRDYKNAFMGYLVFRLVLVQNITLISIPGIPLLTIEVFLSLFFVGLYFLRREQIEKDNSPFPFKIPFIFLFVSWTISTIFAYAGVGSAMSQYLRDVCQNIILVYIMWRLFQNKDDFYVLLIAFSMVMFVSCIYGLLEGKMESNPLADYELSFNSDDERAIEYDYSEEMDRGYRIKSIFEHAIGAGIMWAITIIMLVFYKIRGMLQINTWIGAVILIVLCLLCILLTKSRGPILFLMIASVGFIDFKSRQSFYYLIGGCFVVAIGWDFFSQYANTILSIFSSKAQDEVGGSNAEMRFEQLAVAYMLMDMSPIWGLGFKYLNVMDESLTEDLLGSESMWFTILPQFGLIGIAANLVLAYYMIIKIPLTYHYSKPLFFFALAYWITASLTSVPGMKMYYFYFVYFLMMKHTKWDDEVEQIEDVAETDCLMVVNSESDE